MIKKYVSIILCLSMVLFCTPAAYADNEVNSKIALEQYVSYANSIIPDLVKLPDVTLPATGLYISQPVGIMNDHDDNSYAFFFFNQNICIGELMVSYIDGSFYASFLSAELPAVSAAYVNATPFYLLSMNDSLIMCTASTTEMIVGNTLSEDRLEEIVTQYEREEIHISLQREVLTLTMVTPLATPFFNGLPHTSVTLDVPYVANDEVDDTGICWAASTASIVRYLCDHANLTAMDVYNRVYANMNSAIGTSAHVLNGLSSYGITNYEAQNSAMGFLDFTEQIDAGYPVFLAIEGTSYSLPAYHAVVVCGFYCESDGTDYIQILDSNVEQGKIWINVTRTSNTFIYNTSFATHYTSWGWSVHSTSTE